jgi:hypothetical protein
MGSTGEIMKIIIGILVIAFLNTGCGGHKQNLLNAKSAVQ